MNLHEGLVESTENYKQIVWKNKIKFNVALGKYDGGINLTNVILRYRTDMNVMQIKGKFYVYIKVANLIVWIKEAEDKELIGSQKI